MEATNIDWKARCLALENRNRKTQKLRLYASWGLEHESFIPTVDRYDTVNLIKQIVLFMETFITDCPDGFLTKKDLLNIIYGRWTHLPIEIHSMNCKYFFQMMDKKYLKSSINGWCGCVCNVRSMWKGPLTLPGWKIGVDSVKNIFIFIFIFFVLTFYFFVLIFYFFVLIFYFFCLDFLFIIG